MAPRAHPSQYQQAATVRARLARQNRYYKAGATHDYNTPACEMRLASHPLLVRNECQPGPHLPGRSLQPAKQPRRPSSSPQRPATPVADIPPRPALREWEATWPEPANTTWMRAKMSWPSPRSISSRSAMATLAYAITTGGAVHTQQLTGNAHEWQTQRTAQNRAGLDLTSNVLLRISDERLCRRLQTPSIRQERCTSPPRLSPPTPTPHGSSLTTVTTPNGGPPHSTHDQ